MFNENPRHQLLHKYIPIITFYEIIFIYCYLFMKDTYGQFLFNTYFFKT